MNETTLDSVILFIVRVACYLFSAIFMALFVSIFFPDHEFWRGFVFGVVGVGLINAYRGL